MRIILIGFGVVGRAVARLLHDRRESLGRAHGFRPIVVGLADRSGWLEAPRGIDLAAVLVEKDRTGRLTGCGARSVADLPSLLRSTDADVVIEVTPSDLSTGEPALTHLRTALSARKHVITANKGPLAHAMPALLELARHHGVQFRFSGAVGGGTPVLDFAGKCLPGNRVLSVRGILNGTSNYILTRMSEAGLPFDVALLEAQSAGYAEADPSADVDGHDAAAKLVILAGWAMGRRETLADVRREGIRGVTPGSISEARAAGVAIKLIATADADGLRVRPERIPRTDPLCVHGALNAVTFVTEDAGAQTLIGKGAGGPETASAVMRDLVEVRRGFRVEPV